MAKTRVPIRWKIFLLVSVLISGGILIILAQTSQIFKKDKSAFVKELSAKLASSTSQNLYNQISTIQDKLVIFISSRESLAQTGVKLKDQLPVLFSRYQEFIAIGLMKPKDSGKFKKKWLLRNPFLEKSKWKKKQLNKLVRGLEISDGVDEGKQLWSVKGPDGESLIVVGFGVQIMESKSGSKQKPETAWVAGVLPGDIFDEVLKDFATGLNTGMVLSAQGDVLSHSNPELRGKNFSKHPLVKKLSKSSIPSATGDFKDQKNKDIIGSWEKIPNMNLAVVVTTPTDKAFQAAYDLLSRILVSGGIILVVSLMAAIILSNLMTTPLQKLMHLTRQIGSGNFDVQVDVKSNDEIGDLAKNFATMGRGLVERDEALAAAQTALVQSEKMSAFGQLSAGIAHEVKNPLAGILGHAQLAMGKIKDEGLKKHIDVIEKETRRCKTIVENLMKFARQEKAEMKATDLAAVIEDTINLVDHQLSLAGCKIAKEFEECPPVDANGNHLQQVLLNLMVNASHAMDKSESKVVTVRLKKVDNKAQIQIADTGAGMSEEVQKKIFEPFFTTKPAGKGTGLGLSVSIGIVKDHKGEIYVKSELGKGTTFFIDIPILDKDSKAVQSAEQAVAKAAAANPSSKVLPTSMNPDIAVKDPNQAPAKEKPSATKEAPKKVVSINKESSKEVPKAPPAAASQGKPSSKPEKIAKVVELNVPKNKASKDDFFNQSETKKKTLGMEDTTFFGEAKTESAAPPPKPEELKMFQKKKSKVRPIEVAKKEEKKPEEKAEKQDDTGFKVKVKRPKIKV